MIRRTRQNSTAGALDLRVSAARLHQRGAINLKPALWPALASPPTYSRSAANAATAISNAQIVVAAEQWAFTYRIATNAFGLDASGYGRNNASGQLISSTAPWAIEWLSDSPNFEVHFGANINPRYRLLADQLDGRGFCTTTTYPLADPGTSNNYYDTYTWTSRQLRHYRLECEGTFRFQGLWLGPQDSILRAPREDLTAIMGDSFTEPTIQDTNSNIYFGHEGWAYVFGRGLGLLNTMAFGSGGTGYLNPGTGGRVKFRDRFSEVVAANPARLFFAGGINDANREPTYTAQMEYAECMTLFALAKQQLPYTEIGVFSPFESTGWPTSSLFAFSDAIAQAASDSGLPFYDMFGLTPVASRSSASLTSASAGNSTIYTDQKFSYGQWLRIGKTTSASGWGTTPGQSGLYQTSGSSGSSAPYTTGMFTAVPTGYPIGTPVVSTGRGWVTGNGKQTAAQNNGSADFAIGGDSTHPTIAGHVQLGQVALQSYAGTIGI